MKKKASKWLWLLWAPLILIGTIILAVGIIFLIGSYSVEYGKDNHTISQCAYEDLDRFYVNAEDYVLLVPDCENELLAEKFNAYLGQVLGTTLALSHDVTEGQAYIELLVTDNLMVDYTFTSPNNKNILIIGNNKDHLVRAAYAFLEEFCGIKCYTKDMIVSTTGQVFFPKQEGGYTQDYKDFFEMRDTDWLSPKDDEYSWFRGFNTDEYRYRTDSEEYYEAMGGRTQYISGFCHTFAGEFCSSSKYFDTEEYNDCFALDQNGNRRRDELCLTNPKTLEIVKREVLELLASDKYNPDAPLQIISLTQSDDLTACRCENCVKMAKEMGGFSGPNLVFVNAVAQAVKDAGYENVAIDTFAYRYTRTAPTGVVPLDNVIIRLCSIECCSSHYIDDDRCLANKAFMDDLAAWSQICDRIYIWDYCANFSYFVDIFPNLNVLAHNLRVFYEYNVKGVYEEGNYTLSGDDFEFAELRAYLISKVMQDPYCDYDAVMLEFCNAFYGEAGEDMYNFIMKASTYAGRKHLNIYKDPTLVLSCTKAEFEELNNYFEHAKSVATGTALTNVKNSEISWRYFKMYNKLFEFSGSGYDLQVDYLYRDLYAAKPERLHEVDSNYQNSSLLQTAIVDLRPLFDLVVGGFVYGP